MRNIYIITLIDDKQFKSTNINHLVKEINQYCQDNNIVDIENNIYVFDRYKLKNRIFNGIKVSYPFKTMIKEPLEEHFKDELLKKYPKYDTKCPNTKYKYLTNLLKNKNII